MLRTLAMPLAALALIACRAVSAIQRFLGVERPGRPLSAQEEAMLKPLFGSVDLSQVRIKEGSSGLLTPTSRAWVLGNTIYLPRGKATVPTLVHEMTHVWQYQRGGCSYISDSLLARGLGQGYNLIKGLQQGKHFSQLNVEQQAVLLQWAHAKGCLAGAKVAAPLILAGKDYTHVLRQGLHAIRA